MGGGELLRMRFEDPEVKTKSFCTALGTGERFLLPVDFHLHPGAGSALALKRRLSTSRARAVSTRLLHGAVDLSAEKK
ncbi:hypothetical protein Y1Q_0009088 [Alligator mississippiensis]|uniref:Uncharacterized protein n=1 Tax=Alligator mississippiensis TaxID=8496 RepID=A0A151M283_ALLMI|nr:hypothetical protein Y1Q_0009088 [Alligator mississippiensis]